MIQIAAGNQHVLALTDEGEVFSWGLGKMGRLGLGDTCDRNIPTKVELSEKVTQISAGYDSSIFICESGSVYACGCNRSNKLGLDKKSLMDFFR